MCVPSVRGTGGKGKSVDYGASAWKEVFCRHPASPRIPYPSHASSHYTRASLEWFLCYNYK